MAKKVRAGPKAAQIHALAQEKRAAASKKLKAKLADKAAELKTRVKAAVKSRVTQRIDKRRREP